MATFVLVHGTGHGGWCWQKVANILRSSGSRVYAQTLTGVGDRSHLLDCGVDLSTHITDVANLLFYEDLSDVILVGHSYSGMVITGVATEVPERLGQLIYLDAYVPEEGECEVDLWPQELKDEMNFDSAKSRGLRPPPSPELMGINDPKLAEWVRERTTQHPMDTYTQPVPKGNKQSVSIPRAFISCTTGPLASLFGRFADKARDENWQVREIETGHDAMLTAPDEVVRNLLELAGAT